MVDCEGQISNGLSNVTATVSMEEYWYCSVEYQLHILKSVIPPIIIVTGSIGNILAYVVLTRKNLRQWPICLHLSILAVINTLVLYLGCGLDWLSYVTGKPYIVQYADWICRVWHFIFNVIRHFASWLMVAMSLDRFLTMWLPHKAEQLCTAFIAKVTNIIILIGLVVISVHALWMYELDVVSSRCYIPHRNDFPQFHTLAWPWVTAVIYVYVPILFVFTMIILLLSGLCHPHVYLDANPIQTRFTNIVIVLAILFVMLTMPTVIINLIHYSQADWLQQHSNMVNLWIASEISQVLSCANHGITFALYFAMLPMLRSELRDMTRKLCQRRAPQATTELSNLEAKGSIKKEDCTTVTLL